MLSNPFWLALTTEHARFALGRDSVLRYPADVLPFAGLEHGSAEELSALSTLLAPDEKIFVTGGGVTQLDDLVEISDLPGLQLHFKGSLNQSVVQLCDAEIRRLGPEDATAMVALTDIAFPGFFRARTYQLGTYFGAFCDGDLVAMAGERVAIPGMREISAVCTHPRYTGRGFATALIDHLLHLHAKHGLQSFLHVAAQNKRAITLYEHLGFVTTASIHVRELQRQNRQFLPPISSVKT